MRCRFILPSPSCCRLLILESTSKNADDIVITLAIRTPLAKAGKGGFKDTQLDFLVYSLLKKVIEKSNLDPSLVEDICCGNVRSSLTGSTCTYAL
jgi:acetyl-CoA acetyltransferase